MTQVDRDHHHGLEEKSFDSGEVTLNYAEGEDNGPPLILLHGLGRRWQVFLPLIPSLSLRWHVYALDLRGHGKSGRIPRGYRGTQYSEDVIRFLRQRVNEPAVLFGHSLGGMAAMWVAAHEPDLVKAAILGDNLISATDFEESYYPMLFGGLRDLAIKGGTLEEIASGLAEIRLKLPGLDELVRIGDLPGNDQAFLMWWARCVKQVDPDTYAMSLDGTSLEGWDGESLLARIKCPTLLLQASPQLGGLMSDADVALALKLLSHPVHVSFPTLGHALYIQQPEPILRAVTNFLESL
jgi:pimeloyl-ACP methyl ester carboxylesterase